LTGRLPGGEVGRNLWTAYASTVALTITSGNDSVVRRDLRGIGIAETGLTIWPRFW
jgi:hypothetical protein